MGMIEKSRDIGKLMEIFRRLGPVHFTVWCFYRMIFYWTSVLLFIVVCFLLRAPGRECGEHTWLLFRPGLLWTLLSLLAAWCKRVRTALTHSRCLEHKIIIWICHTFTTLTHSCLELLCKCIIWIYHTFTNYFGPKPSFTKYTVFVQIRACASCKLRKKLPEEVFAISCLDAPHRQCRSWQQSMGALCSFVFCYAIHVWLYACQW